MARYLIGIDLGTTNSALAYLDLRHARGGKPDMATLDRIVEHGPVARW